MTLIRWESHQFGEHGLVAGVRLFTVAPTSIDVKAAAPWVLRCTLPGVDRPSQHPDQAAARAHASIVLGRWLAALADDDPAQMAGLR